MNIMPMLVRLQGALGSTDLIDQILLLPQRPKGDRSSGKLHLPGRTRRAAKRHVQANHASEVASGADAEINLVVGYNSSPKSQTALDLTLWIAHQTRLATRRQVTVQVVYVINPADCLDSIPTTTDFRQVRASKKSAAKRAAQAPALGSGLAVESDTYADPYSDTATLARVGAIATLDEPTLEDAGLPVSKYPMGQAQQFEQADQILWQARCLANEWRGSLKTHLRFGQVAQELRSVAKAESAVLLWLGCDSPKNPIVRTLSANSPCPVLGVPPALHPDRYFDA